jgi:hypothetical protein
MEWLKEWWAVVCGFVATIFWLSRIESAQRHHKEQHGQAPPCVTRGECEQYREAFERSTGLQFGHGEEQFHEIKRSLEKTETAIQRNEEGSQRRHDELVKMILQQREHR